MLQRFLMLRHSAERVETDISKVIDRHLFVIKTNKNEKGNIFLTSVWEES